MKTGWYHIIALCIVVAWGTTYASTKILLLHGLSPVDIIFCRFLLAYLGIWFLGRRQLFADNLKDEFLLILLGFTGGTLYFIAQNIALNITLASNVSLLVSVSPIFTAFLTYLLLKSENLKRYLWYGSLLAFMGVAFIAFNGHFILDINPLGDMLSILAALSWAFYTILLKRLENRYSTLFITRKVFFYGILTLLPFFLYSPLSLDIAVLIQPVVFFNLLYLGIVASLLCFFLWNTVVKNLGAVRTSNYIYLIPPVTLLTSVIIIDEIVTPAALVGAALILTGVVLAER